MPPGPGLVEDCGTLAFFNLKCRLTKLLNLLPAVHKSRPVAQTPVAQGVCGFFPFDSKQQTCKLHRSALLCLINPSIHRGVPEPRKAVLNRFNGFTQNSILSRFRVNQIR